MNRLNETYLIDKSTLNETLNDADADDDLRIRKSRSSLTFNEMNWTDATKSSSLLLLTANKKQPSCASIFTSYYSVKEWPVDNGDDEFDQRYCEISENIERTYLDKIERLTQVYNEKLNANVEREDIALSREAQLQRIESEKEELANRCNQVFLQVNAKRREIERLNRELYPPPPSVQQTQASHNLNMNDFNQQNIVEFLSPIRSPTYQFNHSFYQTSQNQNKLKKRKSLNLRSGDTSINTTIRSNSTDKNNKKQRRSHSKRSRLDSFEKDCINIQTVYAYENESDDKKFSPLSIWSKLAKSLKFRSMKKKETRSYTSKYHSNEDFCFYKVPSDQL